MTDIFAKEIKSGSIVIVAGRTGTRQLLQFGVVLEESVYHNTDFRVKVQCLDSSKLKYHQYAVVDSKNITPTQALVVDKTQLPKDAVTALELCYQDYLDRKKLNLTHSVENVFYNNNAPMPAVELAALRRDAALA